MSSRSMAPPIPSVDDVREIRENVKFTPFRGTYRVYIIDEVHMLSNSAFNALAEDAGRAAAPCRVHFCHHRDSQNSRHDSLPLPALQFPPDCQTEIIERLRHVAKQDQITIEIAA